MIPTVASRHPLWEDRLGQEGGARSYIHAGLVLEHGREALGTTALDAEPDVILKMPGDTLVPLLLALAMTVVTIGLALVNWWVVVVGGACDRGLHPGLAVAGSGPWRNCGPKETR